MFKAMMIWLALFFCAGAAYAENEVSGDAETIAVARDYLEAYQALDLVRLESFYADQVRFNDPTSLRVQGVGGPFIWNGRVEVMNGLRGWSAFIRSLRYDLDRVYEASGHVVFVGAVNPLVATPDGLAQYRYNVVTIVTIESGRVIEHRDYTDYAGATLVPDPVP